MLIAFSHESTERVNGISKELAYPFSAQREHRAIIYVDVYWVDVGVLISLRILLSCQASMARMYKAPFGTFEETRRLYKLLNRSQRVIYYLSAL